ncbi:hypothetical protein GCM10018954_000410 [Kutzneria kofuensis]
MLANANTQVTMRSTITPRQNGVAGSSSGLIPGMAGLRFTTCSLPADILP